MTTSDKSKRIEAACKKASLYGAINRFDAAEKNLMAAVDEFERDNKLLNLLGTMCHRQSRFEEALDFFAEASKKNNHHGLEATVNLAITLCDLGRYEDARNAFTILDQKARLLPVAGPASNALASIHLELARTYISQQLRTEAIAEIKQALKLDENLTEARLELSKLYLEIQKTSNAIAELEVLSTANPQDSEIRIWLGIAYIRAGKSGAARSQWQLAAEQDPSSISLTRSLLSLYIKDSYPQ